MHHLPVLVLSLIFPLSAAAGVAPLIADGPNPNAPEEVKQYGQLAGHWQCKSFNLQPDGNWAESPGLATWSWYYVLEGYAVQDVWLPDRNANAAAPMGTNLRTFDPGTGLWEMVWTTQQVPRLEKYRASYRNGEIHMYAERPASASFPKHLMHITFHNIGETHFDWKYESSGLTDGKNWREVARLSCDKSS